MTQDDRYYCSECGRSIRYETPCKHNRPLEEPQETASDIWRNLQDALLTSFDKWEGRTVKTTVATWRYEDGRLVLFEDGTFSALYPMEGYGDRFLGFANKVESLSVEDLVSAGLLSPKQRAVVINARKAKRRAEEEVREKAQLARLLGKYGTKGV